MRMFKRKLAIGVLLSLSYLNHANATGWPVSDVGLLSYLSNSAAGGVVTDNGGVISLLNQIESDLSHLSSQSTNLAQNSADAANLRDKFGLQDQSTLSRTPDANACYSASNAASGGAGTSSTGSSSTSADSNSRNDVVNAQAGDLQTKDVVYSRQENGFCSNDDVKYKRGNCSSVGTYPKADIDGGGLSGAPLTGAELASDLPRRDVYTADEAQKTRALVKNATSNMPVEEIKDATKANTPAGAYFSALLSAYQSKSLLAQSADNDQVAMKTEIKNLTSEQSSTWSNLSSSWKSWFGVDAPPKPSEWALVKGQVYSRYADPVWQEKTGSMSEQDGVRELVRMEALNGKMMTVVIELLMKNNQLQAASLGNSIQPVTYDSLTQARKAVDGSAISK